MGITASALRHKNVSSRAFVLNLLRGASCSSAAWGRGSAERALFSRATGTVTQPAGCVTANLDGALPWWSRSKQWSKKKA